MIETASHHVADGRSVKNSQPPEGDGQIRLPQHSTNVVHESTKGPLSSAIELRSIARGVRPRYVLGRKPSLKARVFELAAVIAVEPPDR